MAIRMQVRLVAYPSPKPRDYNRTSEVSFVVDLWVCDSVSNLSRQFERDVEA